MDEYGFEYGAEENESPKKGGHTLRRRARVDYTFEQIDDEVVVPSSTSSTRNKKRRSDNSYDSEDIHAHESMRRRASLDADTPSSRRRNPARKTSSEVATYTEEPDEEENDVQDTIEVVGSLSDDENSTSAATVSRANGSGQEGFPLQASEAVSGGSETSATVEKLESNEDSAMITELPKSDDLDEDSDKPDHQLLQEADASTPKDMYADSKQIYIDEPGINGTHIAEQSSEMPSSGNKILEDELQQSTGKAKHDDAQPILEDLIDPTLTMASPKAEEGSEVKAEKSRLSPGPADGAVEKETEQPSSPSLQIQEEQLDGSQAKANVDAEKVSAFDKNSNAKDSDANELKDEDMKDETMVDEPSLNEPVNEPMADEPMVDETMADEPMVDEQMVDEPTIRKSMVDEPIHDESANEKLIGNEPQADSIEKFATPTIEPQHEHISASAPERSYTALDSQLAAKVDIKTLPQESFGPSPTVVISRPQPTPVGRWAYLTPYLDGEHVTYPEKKESMADDETPAEEPTSEEKDGDKYSNGMEPMVEDNDDVQDASQAEAPTPALNTPTRGSPVPESMEPTASNSPVPLADDAEEGDVSDSENVEVQRFFRYRKLRDPEDYISAIENFEDMSTAELYEVLEAINVSLVQWQTEWTGLGKVVDDYENSLRRRLADSKYESRTRNLHQHGINYEEPEFVVKGYKAKEKEVMSETRYLQGQDRIMAAAYGFEYDPHPSKIGRQNPETQQAGIMTRGRSLRNQPRQTAKATEADEVTGKRTRKPVQLFDPAAQDVSRSSTPVPTKTRRRRTGNGDDEMVTSSFNGDANSDIEDPPSRTRRRRAGRPQTSISGMADDSGASQDIVDAGRDDAARPSRRGRFWLSRIVHQEGSSGS
ncbi:hypothetical protein NQ176_g6159 [Zarea fungicola]|uniref:Uncharacterized protein n=1 Tax=Zarea fungicola TaxID=93591 RepID=A0ACC1N6Z3_9HYPO|nr:hypothetical protein NQ176_g6159 [Lecanicillium fungicola]